MIAIASRRCCVEVRATPPVCACDTAIAENDAQREILMPIGMHEETEDASEDRQPASTAELRREGRLARIAKALSPAPP